MPRILEALSRTEPRLSAPPVARPEPAPRSDAAETTAVEEIPYIEVGSGQMEASPVVLQAPGPRAPARETPSPEAVRLVRPTTEPVGPGIRLRPVTAATAGARLAPELIAFHQPDHHVSRQYRDLFDNLAAGSETALAWLLSGVAPGAGATTVLLNLAITAARRGSRTIVVDAALHRPAVAERLGLAPAPGLHEVLAGSIALSRTCQETDVPNLHALTAGEVGGRPCWAVRSLGAALSQLRKRFEVVLVDGPAWTGGAEMTALANACDAVYLVAPHDRAEAPETEALLRKLPRQGVSLRGCIIAQR
jgi:Mrp family chromosome partitioning ATPase